MGILGPVYVATRFMRHAREAANAEVVAVGSRTRERAAEPYRSVSSAEDSRPATRRLR
jgi:hypothetical protein